LDLSVVENGVYFIAGKTKAGILRQKIVIFI